MRFYNQDGALTTSPLGAAIQFWANNSGFPGQAYIDSGASDNAAVIFRTAGTGGTITERMRIDAQGHTKIGGGLLPTQLFELAGGAYSNGFQWINASSRDIKRDFMPVDPKQVLDKLMNLPVQTWSYKDEEGSPQHLGPVAEDFQAAFGLGGSDKSISTVDEEGVALAAIQGLSSQLQDKDALIAVQQTRLDGQ